MGYLYKQKTSQVWWIKYYRNGKCYRESTGTEKESEARKKLRLREGAIAEGKFQGLNVEKILYDELIQDVRNDYKVNGLRSTERLKYSIKHLDTFFKNVKAVNITTATVKEYISKRLEEKAKNGTINRELSALGRAFALAAQQTPPKVINKPFIPKLREDNVREGYLEHREYLSLRDALPTYLKPVLTIAYYTGMRRAEIISIEWQQVNLFEKKVTLKRINTKTNEPRILYLSGELLEVVKTLFADHVNQWPNCPYVVHYKGNELKDFRTAWRFALKRAGISDDRLLHDLRRTGVRNLIRAGIPEKVAMTISGHKTRSVFERYNIINEDDLKAASEKLAKMYETKTEEVQQNPVGILTGILAKNV